MRKDGVSVCLEMGEGGLNSSSEENMNEMTFINHCIWIEKYKF